MVEDVIGIEGDSIASLDRVSVWGKSAGTVEASKAGIIYIFHLNKNSFIQST
jgi:hypothetical protein